MSLAQLVQVKLPNDIGGLTLPDLKSTEKPVEDFMAVLDRALADRTRSEEGAETALRQTKFDAERYQQSLEVTTKAQQANPVGETSPNIADQAPLSARLENPTRSQNAGKESDIAYRVSEAKSKTLSSQSSRIGARGSLGIDHLTVADVRKPAKPEHPEKPLAHLVSSNTALQRDIKSNIVSGEESKLIHQPASRKVNTKSTIVQKGTAHPSAKDPKTTIKPLRSSSDGAAETAAIRMQLHADTGGTKGLQDAMNVVKNLARDLGLDKALAEGGKFLAQSSANSPNLAGAVQTVRLASLAKLDRPEASADAKSSRVEVLRNERLGKKGPESSLRIAADQGRVQVLDLRNQPSSHSLVLENLLNQSQPGRSGGKSDDINSRRDGLQLINSSYIPAAERNTVSIPMYLTGSQAGNLQQALRNHLNHQGNSDIVQQARIVMNGKDTGEIRLILKPESLGEVRIHLQMQDGHIAGKILVENKEVQAAFEDNMPSLLQAFQDGGLNMGAMQVAVNNQGSDNQAFNFQEGPADDRQKLYAVGRLEKSVATVNTVSQDYSQINLVV